ncbi:MAG: SRPBCC family protein [Betaproteobacteria bacterium]|nr:SRPBCC family protein [Betaproteobacteria bacterium]
MDAGSIPTPASKPSCAVVRFSAAFLLFALQAFSPLAAFAAGVDPDIQVLTERQQGRIISKASFRLPLRPCEAFAFLTDYEANLRVQPEIKEWSVDRVAGNKVIVRRLVRDSVLLFPIQLETVVQYTEIGARELSFSLLRGDPKFYAGRWSISSEAGGSRVRYESEVDFALKLPAIVVDAVFRHRLREQFQFLADLVRQRDYQNAEACRLASGGVN